MFFSKSTMGFYAREIHGDEIPDDALEISKELYFSLLEDQSRGKIISCDDLGFPISIYPATPPLSDILDRVKEELRDMRADLLDAVTGIGFRAIVAGNQELAKEAVQISKKLLDITDNSELNASQTYAEMRSAGIDEFRRIASIASEAFSATFKEFK